MTIEYDDKGKIFTEVISKVPINVTVQTTAQMIKGTLHVRRGERLKGELDRDELFLALTDASILGSGGEILFQTPFLAVRRNQIVWVIPEEEE
jgi:hypothetical protein